MSRLLRPRNCTRTCSSASASAARGIAAAASAQSAASSGVRSCRSCSWASSMVTPSCGRAVGRARRASGPPAGGARARTGRWRRPRRRSGTLPRAPAAPASGMVTSSVTQASAVGGEAGALGARRARHGRPRRTRARRSSSGVPPWATRPYTAPAPQLGDGLRERHVLVERQREHGAHAGAHRPWARTGRPSRAR